MSNENLGESTPPVNDKADVVAKKIESLTGHAGQFITRGELIAALRGLFEELTDERAGENRENAPGRPPIVVPAVESRRPVRRRTTDAECKAEDARAIQALVALEMQTGKLPSVVAVCKLSGIGRGILYKPGRFPRFHEIYEDRKKAHEKEAAAAKIKSNHDYKNRGYRTTGGGLEAIDFDDDDE